MLFPNNPRMVLHRKLQALGFTVFFTVLVAALVGLMFWLLNKYNPH
jgi:hypothetical protein